MAGFGEQARQYLEFLKQHQDAIRILQYGYRLSQEAFSEQVVTDSLDAVAERVEGEVKRSEEWKTPLRGQCARRWSGRSSRRRRTPRS